MPRFSSIVTAQGAADYLPYCLDSIARAAQTIVDIAPDEVCETIVAAHRCDDATLTLAHLMEARVVEHGDGPVSATRNAATATSRGEYVVHVDADCMLPICALSDIDLHLADPWCVGGGAGFVPERRSLGIGLAVGVRRLGMAVTGLGGALHWCRRDDFDAIEGFNDLLHVGEQSDFGRRLREHGRHSGRRYTNLVDTPVVVSSQRFHRYGDWHLLGSLTRRSTANGPLSPAN
jgi:glycosyltransferase involved in cell wall biosynthesis